MKMHGGSLDKNILDFSANTSPLGMHPSSIETLSQIALNPSLLSVYPDSDCVELKNELSKFWKFDSKNIICASGAADLIYLISNVFGKNSALIFEPSFSEYEKSLLNLNCEILHFDFDKNDEETFDEELNSFSNKNISLLFVSSPSNPLGQILSFEQIEKIEKFCQKENAVFVLDACFCQFSKNAENIVKKVISQKEKFQNLVILNAFTKFYGMAGIRLGYALCFSSKIAQKLNQNLRSWSVSSVAQLCGIAVLKSENSFYTNWSSKIQNLVETEKKRFYEFFDSHKIKYFKSEANFITFEFNFDSYSDFIKIEKNDCVEILEKTIQIRSCSTFKNLGKNFHRIAIKNAEENSKLLDLFQKLFAENSKIESNTKIKKAKSIMIQGTMSNAGKSLLVAALCRIFKKDGFKVAPFKSQNMALNSGVTKDGKEMGRAQIVQAECAEILPDVRMNPILLKPNSDTGSQIIVNGEIYGNMSAKDYFKFRKNLIPQIMDAYNSLAEENDIIVIEGAGSPAEINLKNDDIVNMGLAELVDAPVLLAGDIDRGGVFASLFGTFALVSQNERNRIKGFLINKFRGDVKLLESGLEQLYNLTEKRVFGVIPFISNLKIEDEDSLSSQLENEKLVKNEKLIKISVIRLPYISNFTDLNNFSRLPFVDVEFFDSVDDFDFNSDLLILPGSKNSIKSMEFLNEKKLCDLIKNFAKEKLVIGICGGFQLLGELLDDSNGSEDSSSKKMQGLGLLPIQTTFTKEKTKIQVNENLPNFQNAFENLSNKKVSGYEIHQGLTTDSSSKNLRICTKNNVFGTYIHGFFDSSQIVKATLEILAKRKSIILPNFEDYESEKEKEYDRLEKIVRNSIDLEKIYEIIGIKK